MAKGRRNQNRTAILQGRGKTNVDFGACQQDYLGLVQSGPHRQTYDEATFNEVIVNALSTIEATGQREVLWRPDVFYNPDSVTTDGWRAVQNTWGILVPGIALIECNLHGRKRVSATHNS